MTRNTKLIFVTGGVMSGVGKGVATASIARILQENGFSVNVVKIDPYINYDAGTLRPTEHGEVWVTDDGGEIDQDLGNYERFLGFDIAKRNNITTGQIYKAVIDRERRGEYLGQTVQPIPHVVDEVKRRIMDCAKNDGGGKNDARSASGDYDFVIVEIGGTVGDYENMLYLFAAKSFELELGRDNVAHILITYLPVPSHIGEMKTKPAQQSVRMLNEQGIFPDFILCRSETALDDVRKKKIQVSTNVNAENIVSAPDIKTIYRIPLNYEKENLGEKILRRFFLKSRKKPDWAKWKRLVSNIENPSDYVKVAIVGKYVDTGAFTLADSYISVNQSLEHAGASLGIGVKIGWVDAKQVEKGSASLKDYDGIIVPVGFGATATEGKIAAIKYARENNVPFLGLCFGLQMAVIEYARNVCGLRDANSVEINPRTPHPVVDVQPAQREILAQNLYGGTMRLGAYAATVKKSLVLQLYRKTGRLARDEAKIRQLEKDESQKFRVGVVEGDAVLERHRHRYEVNPKYVQLLADKGLFFSGHHTRFDGTKLMEFIELPSHRFFVATQAHPEFKSRIGDPSPLFLGFVAACRK